MARRQKAGIPASKLNPKPKTQNSRPSVPRPASAGPMLPVVERAVQGLGEVEIGVPASGRPRLATYNDVEVVALRGPTVGSPYADSRGGNLRC